MAVLKGALSSGRRHRWTLGAIRYGAEARIPARKSDRNSPEAAQPACVKTTLLVPLTHAVATVAAVG